MTTPISDLGPHLQGQLDRMVEYFRRSPLDPTGEQQLLSFAWTADDLASRIYTPEQALDAGICWINLAACALEHAVRAQNEAKARNDADEWRREQQALDNEGAEATE